MRTHALAHMHVRAHMYLHAHTHLSAHCAHRATHATGAQLACARASLRTYSIVRTYATSACTRTHHTRRRALACRHTQRVHMQACARTCEHAHAHWTADWTAYGAEVLDDVCERDYRHDIASKVSSYLINRLTAKRPLGHPSQWHQTHGQIPGPMRNERPKIDLISVGSDIGFRLSLSLTLVQIW